MKTPESLKEVWRWKRKCYEKYKGKSIDEMFKLIGEKAIEFERKHNLKHGEKIEKVLNRT